MIAHIRNFRDQDFSRLLQIDQACFEPGIAYDDSALHYYIYQINGHTLVLADDCEVVGFGIATVNRGRGKIAAGHIITIDLLPQARGQGYGKALLRQLEGALARDGAVRVDLEVDIRNERAIGFYLKMGYCPERRLRNYYGSGKDAIRMRRNFSPAESAE